MADLGFDNKVAIITGAGGGLGRQHALELARRGARIVVNDLGGSLDGHGHTDGPADKVVAEIEAMGGEAVANTDSVATPEGGEAIVAAAVEAFYTTLPAYKIMREKNYGRIVNTTSNSGLLGNFGQSNYGAAKMGLVGFTRVLANEGAKRNIKVNAIAPVAKTATPSRTCATTSTPSVTTPTTTSSPTRPASWASCWPCSAPPRTERFGKPSSSANPAVHVVSMRSAQFGHFSCSQPFLAAALRSCAGG